MKILFLNTNIDYAGATKIMLWLAGRLAEIDDEVTFLTYRDASENREVPKGVEHVHLQLEAVGHSIRGLMKSIIHLHKHIKAEHYDLGIAFLSPSHLRLSLAAIGTRTKVLLSQRGDPYQSSRSKSMLSRITRYAFKKADMFVFQTQQAMDYYDESIKSRAVVIPNPVNPLRRTCKRIPDKRIINLARLDMKQKRQDVLIDAFKLISKDYPDISLHFYGDGEDEELLRKRAEGNSRIFFEGITHDVVRDSQNAKLFVLSSDFEGIPNALIEAMSLGLPSISTKCSPGGAELLIDNGVNGLLAPRGDAKELAGTIRRFLDDPSFAEKCGQKAKEIVETFSEDKIFMLWEKLIHSDKGRRHPNHQ